MTHRTAVALMVVVTLLWSMAGIVSRQIEQAQGLELTFWRSAFNAVALVLILSWRSGPLGLAEKLAHGGWLLWASGACWALMFTAFMAALTMTTVANVLLTMALAPLFTALLAWLILRQALERRTMLAIALAVVGMVWMQWPLLSAAESPAQAQPSGSSADGSMGAAHPLAGTLVALAVPLGGAMNWIIIRAAALRPQGASPAPDLLPAVLIGATLSAIVTAPWAVPTQATSTDLAWLALLGVFQLAVPCLLAVRVARVLSPTEVALLSLLEVLFGVAWAWLGTAEAPSAPVLLGGALVLGALVINEAWGRVGATRQRAEAQG